MVSSRVPSSTFAPLIVKKATDWWQDFLSVTSVSLRPGGPSVISRWLCPLSDRLKVNVDGAWLKDLCLGGVGIAIKNSQDVITRP